MNSFFPYFGNKRKVADIIWSRLGNDLQYYFEPFFGSGSILLHREQPVTWEIVNDISGFICNAFRSIKHNPKETAKYADYPVIQADLQARHQWLYSQNTQLAIKLKEDHEYYDAKIAGLWIHGMCCVIGDVWMRSTPQACAIRNNPSGIMVKGINIYELFNFIQKRLRHTHILNGDWEISISLAKIDHRKGSTVGFVFDPPYSVLDRHKCYEHDDYNVSKEVAQWCIDNGDNPNYRIVLCGYEEEHKDIIPSNWEVYHWQTDGGMSKTKTINNNTQGTENSLKETIWFSPHCIKPIKKMFD